MADRYQEQPFPINAEHDRGAVRDESDPLAELAQLTGQSDPFGTAATTSRPLQSRANVRPQYAPAKAEASTPAGSPRRMQRAKRRPPPQHEYEEQEPEHQPSPVHPLHRYAAPPAAASEHDHHEPQERAAWPDQIRRAGKCSRSGLSGRSLRPSTRLREEPEPRTRSGGMVTVAAALALAVAGTGAALTYRTYVGSPRSGEPPIIGADNSATNVVPAQSRCASKIPDRMPPGYGGEKLVSRDEASVDVNSSSGASLVVFPPLNQNSSPPPVASVSPTGPALATAANGTMPNNEPRKIKVLAVKGDAAENGGIPAGAAAPAKPDPAARSASAPAALAQRNPSAANASANAPPTLSPQSAPASDPAPRSVSPPPMPSGRLPRPAAIIWFRSPRRRTRPTCRPPTARCKTSFRPRWGPVRRSSSAPISATRGSITAPWSARSDPPKRRPSSAAI